MVTEWNAALLFWEPSSPSLLLCPSESQRLIQERSNTLQTNESQPWEFAETIEEKIVLLLRLLGWKDVSRLLLAAHSEESGDERQRDGGRKNVKMISLNS